LAARTGVTVRNIRAYTTARLLPPPRLQGRLGLYGDEHVQRLALIRELRAQGFGIEAIRRIFGRTPAASWRDLLAVARSVSGSLFAEET
ncbi:helix-turn-helix domain-containing protein, partial [Salmonella enterica subsp. enterica]|uniref:helix-turn-helix domain-containing protein n=1 Tax=Salmonella enterica TaxID=28901 RepID=UPI0022B6B89E|nr:helix-turn-helix domain-containing protein [Salmonella enterica]